MKFPIQKYSVSLESKCHKFATKNSNLNLWQTTPEIVKFKNMSSIHKLEKVDDNVGLEEPLNLHR